MPSWLTVTNVLAVLGAVSVIAGLLARLLPAGSKAQAVAAKLGLLVGEAIALLAPKGPPSPPSPPAVVAALCVALALPGCAWWASHSAALTADAEKEAACILAHSDVFASAADPLTKAVEIGIACGGVEQAIVLDLFSAQPSTAPKASAAKASLARPDAGH